VLFSGLTVASALAALLVFPQRFLYSMGVGGVMVALIAVVVALVVLPAVLALLGDRVNALAPARLRSAADREARVDPRGRWARLARWVMRRPGRVALGTAALLLVMGAPFARIEFVQADATVLPPGAQARHVDDRIGREFGPHVDEPVRLVVRAAPGPRTEAVRAAAGAVPGVGVVGPARPAGGGLSVVELRTPAAPPSDEARRVVADLRALDAPAEVLVTGSAAQFADLRASLADHLPGALLVVVGGTLVLLFLLTGSVVLPIKALILNALTLSATFGLLVLLFQDGRLEGLLGYTSQGALEITQPVLLFAVVFGLSTDYGVFLLARIKEARDAGAGEREAVAMGLERTGRIVTAAALLFSVAIGAFATSQIVFIKELGVGTALAVLIDATIVRALLVPSLMALLGRHNWWAPRPLRRLHARVGLAEG
jgi:RND superfamily putative drug exporter